MTSFERKWKGLLAAAASAASQASRNPGGPLLTADSTTAEVEAWLQWNDPNGSHLPAMAEAEGFEPYADEDAWEALGQMIIDSASPAWRAEYFKAVEEAMIAEREEADRIAAERVDARLRELATQVRRYASRDGVIFGLPSVLSEICRLLGFKNPCRDGKVYLTPTKIQRLGLPLTAGTPPDERGGLAR